jgi:hypothetical protein
MWGSGIEAMSVTLVARAPERQALRLSGLSGTAMAGGSLICGPMVAARRSVGALEALAS